MSSRPYLLLAFLAACGSGGGLGDDAGGGEDAALTDGTLGGDDGGGGDGDGGGGGDGGDGGTGDGGTGDGGTGDGVALCGGHQWSPPLSVSGTRLMAFRGKAYLFASNGLVWTVIEHQTGTTGPIPFPPGVTSMQAISAEIGLNGLPLIGYRSDGNNSKQHATFFDGTQFSTPIEVNANARLHADAAGRIYAYGANGFVEYAAGQAPLYRGMSPHPSSNTTAWNVAADGTLYMLFVTAASVSGGTMHTLQMIRLPHNSLTWSTSTVLASNLSQGFNGLTIAAAPDGSLHIVWERGGGYLRSHDGVTWEQGRYTEFAATATMIDPATASNPSFDPRILSGVPELLAAHDYDRVSVTTITQFGSSYPSSIYFARRCPPFGGPNQMQWPADRFAYGYAASIVAVDERGLATIVTPSGVRQDVVVP
ncbi:MAG: hypothetical protein JWP01_1255 [Myxococcales bacterium]|nr:hypothetical protein [Myxococcales bacterium]